MKRPTFVQGAALAFVLSLAGAALMSALGTVLSPAAALRIITAGAGLAYVLYLLGCSGTRVGRMVVLAAWAGAALAIWFLAPATGIYVLAHIALIWLVRSLYFYSSVLLALADLGLGGLGLGAAIWAAAVTHSVFATLWCFFLVQALFVAIPRSLDRNHAAREPVAGDEVRFEHAHRVAESALRNLSVTH